MTSATPPGTILARGFEWDQVRFEPRRIGEVADLRYGKALVERNRRPGPVPMFGTNGPCGWHDEPLANGPGVILGRKGQGHLGVKWCPTDFWVIDTAYYASVDPTEVDLRWFYYATSYVGLDHLKTGEKPGLSRDIFSRQIFPFPSLAEQKSIARVLSILDDKIATNCRLNETLEATGRAVFDHCCGTWTDDPTSLVRCQELIDTGVLVIGDGYRAKRIELSPTGLPFARAANINDGFRFESAELLGEPGVARAKHKVSVPGDVVFTSKGTVGRFAFVSASTPRFVYSPQLCFWRAVDTVRLCPTYLLYWMRSRSFLDQVDAVKGQTDMADYVSLTDQRLMQVIVPPESVQARVAAALDPIQEHCALLVVNSQTLAALRDELLPRLLSGELRVRQAEKLVEEAV